MSTFITRILYIYMLGIYMVSINALNIVYYLFPFLYKLSISYFYDYDKVFSISNTSKMRNKHNL